MTDDVIEAALAGAKAALDIQDRLWVIGVARLADIPEIREFSEAEVREVIDLARETSDFPSGPAGYLPDGVTQELEEDYRLVSLAHPDAPHLQMKLGLGIAGFVAIGLTRTGNFGSGIVDPSGVLISDVESVMADVYTLALTAAVLLGYFGPIDMAFTLSDVGPGAQPSFYALDETTGRPVRTFSLSAPMEVIEDSTALTSESTNETLLADLLALVARFTATIDSAPQLMESRFAGSTIRDRDPLGQARSHKAAGH